MRLQNCSLTSLLQIKDKWTGGPSPSPTNISGWGLSGTFGWVTLFENFENYYWKHGMVQILNLLNSSTHKHLAIKYSRHLFSFSIRFESHESKH